MRCLLGAKKRFYASVMMTALLLLHVALASISPFQLFSSITNGGFDSYIRAMDVSSANSLATTADNRARVRGRSISMPDLSAPNAVPAVFAVVGALLSPPKLFTLDTWNRLIGQELSSKPHADMVSLK